MSKSNQIWQVCELWDCDCEPVMNVKAGSQTHNYCCQKGLEKTLIGFQEYLRGLEVKNPN